MHHVEINYFSVPAISKALSYVFLSSVVTLALFWIMSELIGMDEVEIVEPTEHVVIDPTFQERDSKVNEPEELPEPPPKLVQPPETEMLEMEPDIDVGDNAWNGNINIAVPEIETSTNTVLTVGNGEARPIVRIEPRYPLKAAQDGIEGWVRLSFSINEVGGVENVEVIDAEPKRIFNKEARRALRKWKYQAKIVDGKAVPQHNMMVELTFAMEKQG